MGRIKNKKKALEILRQQPLGVRFAVMNARADIRDQVAALRSKENEQRT